MDNQHDTPDPVYRSSLAEMRWILLMWLVCFGWTIGYSRIYGYTTNVDSLSIVMGMPSWVFWGVFIPWIAASVISCWFALTQIDDHPLDGSSDE